LPTIGSGSTLTGLAPLRGVTPAASAASTSSIATFRNTLSPARTQLSWIDTRRSALGTAVHMPVFSSWVSRPPTSTTRSAASIALQTSGELDHSSPQYMPMYCGSDSSIVPLSLAISANGRFDRVTNSVALSATP